MRPQSIDLLDGVVDCLNTICIVHRKFRIEWSLHSFINNSIDYPQCIHVQLNTFDRAIVNGLILLVEVVIEGWTVMSSVTSLVNGDSVPNPHRLTSQSTS